MLLTAVHIHLYNSRTTEPCTAGAANNIFCRLIVHAFSPGMLVDMTTWSSAISVTYIAHNRKTTLAIASYIKYHELHLKIYSSFHISINFHLHNNVKTCFKMFKTTILIPNINSYTEGLNTLCFLNCFSFNPYTLTS